MVENDKSVIKSNADFFKIRTTLGGIWHGITIFGRVTVRRSGDRDTRTHWPSNRYGPTDISDEACVPNLVGEGRARFASSAA